MRPWTGRAVDVGLAVAALAGIAVLAWTALSAALGLQLVTFATGSMSPEYPVGSLAVSRPVPLAEVRVGDVVTVGRGAGILPITHRVQSVEVHDGTARLTLKGDANRFADPAPYLVRSVRVVVLPLAGLSTPVRLATAPIGVGVGAAAVAAALLLAVASTRRPAAAPA